MILAPTVARRDGRYSFGRTKEYPENAPGLRRLKVSESPFIEDPNDSFAPDPITDP